MSKLALHVLATGSKGNCSVIENRDTGRAVVIDCGICNRDFVSRCTASGIELSSIDAFFITHAHTDHTSGLGVVLRGLAKKGITPAVYANSTTVNESSALQKLVDCHDFRAMEAQQDVSEGGMIVHPFATSHDTLVSFGFRIEGGADAVGFMTDTGIVTDQASEALQQCRILAIEANHDIEMLENGPYPYWLQQRIRSSHGHLSNEQATELASSLSWSGLEHVCAMHASENNNTYELAHAAVMLGAGDASTYAGLQRESLSIR